LYEFIEHFSLDLLIPENFLAIPLNIPLALTELIAETCLPLIAHHHDLAWERKRFLVNSLADYIGIPCEIIASIKKLTPERGGLGGEGRVKPLGIIR
jgi:hypothetical protein